ncbi:hypothetical protein SDJN03_06285, partial [Cucurbita argyrosperma subsp. sororia]
MALQSDYQLTGAGDDEAAAAARNRKKATVCELSASQTARITQQFDHSFIAWIFGKDVRPWRIASLLRRHLCLTGTVKVFELGLGYFVLKFCETDFLALQDLPWSVPNLCIHVSPWTPDFKPSETILSSVDVWVRLHELSIEYYDDEVLQKIAAAIGGDLVKIDPVTKNRLKCKFARICVRVNLCDPLPSMIRLGKIRQEIEYEGFELLCPNCSRVDGLRHNCLNLKIPSGFSGFNPHRVKPHHHGARSFKQPLIPSESSAPSPRGSRFQVLDLNSNEWPTLGESGKAGTSIRTSSSPVHVKDKAIAKKKEKCGVSVQPLPKESSKVTIKDQLKAAKTSNNPTVNEQPTSPTPSLPPLLPCPASEAILNFHSAAIQRSTRTKEITDAPSKEINVDSCPTVYTIDPKIATLDIALSETRTTSMSNQIQYAIEFVPTTRDGDKGGVDSGSESCGKKILCWKFHWTDNEKLIRSLKDLIKLHEPSIVLIFGTKISGADVDKVVQELPFCYSYYRKPDGYSGGVWLLLSNQDVETKVNSCSPQQLCASIYFDSKTNAAAFNPSGVQTKASSGPWGSPFFHTPTNWMTSMAY